MNSHGVIRLRLLGAPAIVGPSANGEAVLRQPKRLLLLAYLAARDEFVTRDTLLGLFWPALSEGRARRALSQAIHFLRSDLGRDAILTRGSTEIAIGEDILCDVPEYERAIREESWEAALDLYGGELMCGVIPPRAPAIEQWLETDRATLRRQATKAANTLSHTAFHAGDLASAIAWRRRTLEISPFDEAAHKDYFLLLEEAGDAAGALSAFEGFRSKFREAYELEPSAETLHVIDLIRSRHSRVATPERVSDPSDVEQAVSAVRTGRSHLVPADRRSAKSGLRRWLRSPKRVRGGWQQPLGVSAVLIIAVLATLLMTLGQDDTSGMELPLIPNRVAVLYFTANSEDPEVRYLADGLTEALISYLGQARSLDVVSANGVRPFRGLAPPLDTITGRLQAATIVGGAVSRSGTTTYVTVDVIDGQSGSIKQPVTVRPTSGDPLQIIEDVTAAVANVLSPILGDAVALGRWQAGTENPLAWQHVLSGTGKQKSADRYADLGIEDGTRVAYAAADAEFEKASRLDPEWLEPTVMRGDLDLGMAFFCMFQMACEDGAAHWLDQAIDHADEALAINGVHPGALELKGRATLQKWIVDADPDPALMDEARRALIGATTIDGSRASAWAALSAANFARADFESAETTAGRALAEDAFLADRAEIQMRLFQSAFHRGHDVEAARWCDAVYAFRRSGNWMGADCRLNLMAWSERDVPDVRDAWLEVGRGLQHAPTPVVEVAGPRLNLLVAAVLARAGMPDSAEHVIKRALAAAPDHDLDILYYAAGAYTALGDTTQALHFLSKFQDGSPDNRQHVVGFRWFESVRGLLVQPVTRSPGG